MEPSLEQWQYPIGRYQAKELFSAEEVQTAIEVLKEFPKSYPLFFLSVVKLTSIVLIAQGAGK